jgi:hypothetical protein
MGDADDAVQTFSKIGTGSRLRAAGLFAAARKAGKTAEAKSHANAYSALGVVEGSFLRGHEGMMVMALYPGGLLARVEPKIHPSDVIEYIDSDTVSAKKLDKLSKAKLPDKPVSIKIRRGDLEFRAELDYPALAKELEPAEESPDPDDAKPGDGGAR